MLKKFALILIVSGLSVLSLKVIKCFFKIQASSWSPPESENTIKQFSIDKDELKFLRLNLEYGHKCRKSFFNSKGFIVGTNDYKKCVLGRGD